MGKIISRISFLVSFFLNSSTPFMVPVGPACAHAYTKAHTSILQQQLYSAKWKASIYGMLTIQQHYFSSSIYRWRSFQLCADAVCGFRNLSRRDKESLEMKKKGGNRGRAEKGEASGKKAGGSFSSSISSCGRSALLCCIWGWGCHATVLA